MKLKDVLVRGQKLAVEVDGDGSFSAKVGEATVTGKSMEDLLTKLERATKIEQARVAIKFARWDDGLKRGTVIGVHAANNNLLIKWEGVKGTSQEWPHGRYGDGSTRFLRLTPEQEQQLAVLYKAEQEAVDAREEFESKYAFDIKTELQGALKDAEAA